MAAWARAHALRERSWLLEWPRGPGQPGPGPGEAVLACRPGGDLGFLCAAQPAEGLRPVMGTSVRARVAEVPAADVRGELLLGDLRLLLLRTRPPRAVRLGASGPAAALGAPLLLRLLRRCPFLAAGSVVELPCGLVHVSGEAARGEGEPGGAVLMLEGGGPDPPASLAPAADLRLLTAPSPARGALAGRAARPEACHFGNEEALAEFAGYLDRQMLRGVLVCGPAGSGRDGFVARGLEEAGYESLWLSASDLLLADRSALSPLRDSLGDAYGFWNLGGGREQRVLPAYDGCVRAALAGIGRTGEGARGLWGAGASGSQGAADGPGAAEQSPRPALLRELFALAGEWVRASGGARLAVVLRDVDELFPARTEAAGEKRELSSTLLALMDGAGKARGAGAPGGFTLVGICADPSRLDIALRRPGRFEVELELRLPDRATRAEIIRSWLGLPAAGAEDWRPLLEAAVDATANCCGSDIRAMIGGLRAGRGAGRAGGSPGPAELAESPAALLRELVAAAARFRPTASRVLQFYVEPPAPRAVQHLAPLFDAQLAALARRFLMPVLHPRLYERVLGPSSRRGGTMVCGPAGSGKTAFLRRLCAALAGKFSFFEVKCGAIYSKYVGESEANLRRAFREARSRTPSVLVLDDFDVLVGGRREDSAREDSVSGRVLGTLLTELDGLCASGGLFSGALHVIAVTRDPGRLDAALTRYGRFDDRVVLGFACGPGRGVCGPGELGSVLACLASEAGGGAPEPVGHAEELLAEASGLAAALAALPGPFTIGALSSWARECGSRARAGGGHSGAAAVLREMRGSLSSLRGASADEAARWPAVEAAAPPPAGREAVPGARSSPGVSAPPALLGVPEK